MTKRALSHRKTRKILWGRVIFVLTVFVLFTIFFLYQLLSKPSEFITLTTGTLALDGSYDAVILRGEKLIKISSDGDRTYFFSEGQIVEKDELLLSIRHSESEASDAGEPMITDAGVPIGSDTGIGDVELSTSLTNENTSVGSDPNQNLGGIGTASGGVAIDESGLNSTQTPFADLEMLSKELEELRPRILLAIEKRDISELSVLKEDYLNRQERIDILSQNPNTQEILTYDRELDSKVYAPVSGRISYQIDGFEEVLTLSKIYSLDFSSIFSLESPSIRSNDYIKIIDPSIYHLAIKVPLTEFNSFKNTTSVVVKVDNLELKGRILDTISDGKTAIAIIQMRESFSQTYQTRRVHISITRENFTGLVIPNSAIINENGQTGVLEVQTDGQTRFTPIKIVHYGANESICESEIYYDPNKGNVRTVNLGAVIKRVP